MRAIKYLRHFLGFARSLPSWAMNRRRMSWRCLEHINNVIMWEISSSDSIPFFSLSIWRMFVLHNGAASCGTVVFVFSDSFTLLSHCVVRLEIISSSATIQPDLTDSFCEFKAPSLACCAACCEKITQLNCWSVGQARHKTNPRSSAKSEHFRSLS